MDQLSTIQIILLVMILLLNIRAYILFYTDKRRAVQGSRNRISERKLILSAFLLGGIGSLIGMSTLRHKTKHIQFQILIPIAAVLTIIGIYYVLIQNILH